jgi:hypothetical protein
MGYVGLSARILPNWFTLLAFVILAKGTCFAQRACMASQEWTQQREGWVSFSMPGDWSVSVSDTDQANSVAIVPSGYQPDKAPCQLTIQRVHALRNGALQTMSDSYFGFYEQANPGLKPLANWTNMTLHGAPALIRSYDCPGNDGGIERGIIFTTLVSGELLAVIAAADLTEWPNRAKTVFSKILISLNLHGGPPIQSPTAAESNKCHAAELGPHYTAAAVSFDYPTDWQAVPSEDGSIVRVFPKGTAFANSACALEMLVVNRPPSGDLRAGVLDFFQRLQKRVPGTERSGEMRSLTVANTPALLLPFKQPASNGGTDLGQVVGLLTPTGMLVASSSSADADWPQARPIISRIIGSLRLNGGAGAIQQFHTREFAFSYPGDWRIVGGSVETGVVLRGDRSGQTFQRVKLEPLGGDATMSVLYGQYKPGVSCGEIAQYLGGSLNVEYTISYFDFDDLHESFPAGDVFTRRYARSRKEPGKEVLRSIVCSAGRVAVVVFGYPSGYPRTARELLMRTLSFANNSLRSFVGDWSSEDGVLTLNADGSAALSFNGGFLKNRGTYSIHEQTISFAWSATVVPGIPSRQTCSYSVRKSGAELALACTPGPKSWILRR